MLLGVVSVFSFVALSSSVGYKTELFDGYLMKLPFARIVASLYKVFSYNSL